MSSTSVHSVDFERLRELLTEQCRLHGELSQLSLRQRDAISDDSEQAADTLLRLLGDRQRIVQNVSRLNQELAPFRRDWERTLAALPEARRALITGLVKQLDALLGAILGRDREDQARLETRRQMIRSELDVLSGGSRAQAGYGKAVSPASIGSADLTG